MTSDSHCAYGDCVHTVMPHQFVRDGLKGLMARRTRNTTAASWMSSMKVAAVTCTYKATGLLLESRAAALKDHAYACRPS